MKKILYINILLVLGLQAQTLTLQESINKTLLNHPDIKTFALKVTQSHTGYRSARADYLPQVNLSAEYDPSKTYVFPFNGAFHTQDDSGWNAGISLKQKIWDFSKTTSKMDASKVDENIAALSLEDVKALIASKVKNLYALMLVQKEAIEVRKQDLHAKEAYYAQAKALFAQGLKTEADTSRFLSALYLAKDNLAIAESSYEKAKNSLSLYMGEKIPEDVTLDAKVLKKELHLKRFDEDTILASNRQMQIYEQTVNKNILLHKSAQATHFGSLDLLASYNKIGSLNEYDSKMLGIVLNVPLYSGGKTTAQAQNVAIAAQIAKEQKASKLLNLKEELTNLMLDIQRYDKTIQAKKAQLDAAASTQKVLQGRYKEGLATYIEVLDATALVLNAKLGLLEAYYARTLSMNRIDYLQGKI
jgi:outer membrane protein TolC